MSLGFLVDLLDFLVAIAGVGDIRFHGDGEKWGERRAWSYRSLYKEPKPLGRGAGCGGGNEPRIPGTMGTKQREGRESLGSKGSPWVIG